MQFLANPTGGDDPASSKASGSGKEKKAELAAFKPARSHGRPLPVVPYMADPMQSHKVRACDCAEDVLTDRGFLCAVKFDSSILQCPTWAQWMAVRACSCAAWLSKWVQTQLAEAALTDVCVQKPLSDKEKGNAWHPAASSKTDCTRSIVRMNL